MAKFRIQRSLDLLECISVILGMVIGGGIFVNNDVIKNIGSPAASLCVIVFCGLIMSCGAYSLVELATALPRYGGDYIYVYEAFGPLLGFLHLWSAILTVVPCTTSLIVTTFAQNIVDALLPTCAESGTNIYKLVAIPAICFVTYIHCVSVKFPTRLQNCFMFIKITMLVLIILSGFLWMMINGVGNLKSPFQGTAKDARSWALAIYYSLFSYNGWNYILVLMEEIKEPEKTLPKAMNISLLIILISYFFVNLSYVTVLGIDGVTKSTMVSVDYGKLALSILKPWAMPAMVGFSTLGSLSVNTMMVSRLCVAGARNGHLPELLHQINVYRLTPLPSLIFTMILAVIMVIVPVNITLMLTFSTFVYSFFVFLSVTSCIVLRYRRPKLKRFFMVPLFAPCVFAFFYIILLIILIIRYPVGVAIGIATIASGVPVYYLIIVRRSITVDNVSTKITHALQKLLLTAHLDDEDDGDNNEITVKNRDQKYILRRKSVTRQN